MRQVVITGLGVVSPLGNHIDAFWANLILGKSGIGPITLFDASMFPIRIGGEVKDLRFESITRVFPEVSNCRDRKVFFALAAANQAIDNAKLSDDTAEALLHIGIGLETFCLEDMTPYADSPDLGGSIMSSLAEGQKGRSLQTPLDLTCRILGNRYGFMGGRYTNCSACAAGTQVIGEAWQMLHEGAAEVALAGATDSMLNPLGLGGFSLLRVLSGENDTPQR
ncbi:MAG: beta-ketoacyl synthase N-terminal-like domain-containing protein, partial [Planctomycetota bacterium]